MALWTKLQNIGLLKRNEQPDIVAECSRFKADQAFQQYLDAARFNIITELHGLDATDVDGFTRLKLCQQALDGFSNFMEQAIISEMMKERNNPPTG